MKGPPLCLSRYEPHPVPWKCMVSMKELGRATRIQRLVLAQTQQRCASRMRNPWYCLEVAISLEDDISPSTFELFAMAPMALCRFRRIAAFSCVDFRRVGSSRDENAVQASLHARRDIPTPTRKSSGVGREQKQ